MKKKYDVTWKEDMIVLILTFLFVCLMGAALTGCASLESKAVAVGSGVDALKIETTGSLSSGTILPNFILGGAASSICTAPPVQSGMKTQIVYSRVRRNSFFGELFGIEAGTETICYIGSPGESAEETAVRCKALSGLGSPERK